MINVRHTKFQISVEMSMLDDYDEILELCHIRTQNIASDIRASLFWKYHSMLPKKKNYSRFYLSWILSLLLNVKFICILYYAKVSNIFNMKSLQSILEVFLPLFVFFYILNNLFLSNKRCKKEKKKFRDLELNCVANSIWWEWIFPNRAVQILGN